MTAITVDAVDAVELAEILEFLVECLDLQHITTLPACDHDIYNSNDLRADITRLVGRLLTSPLTDTTACPDNDLPELIAVNRGDIEDIAHILGQLEDFLLHGDDHTVGDLAAFLSNDTGHQQLARSIGELANYLRRLLFPHR